MRLIDAEVFKELVESWLKIYKSSIDYQTGVQKSLHMIDVIPTVDAEPVVHARWGVEIDTGAEMYVCSSCKCRMIKKDYDRATGTNAKSFCPYCGAKMDGEEK